MRDGEEKPVKEDPAKEEPVEQKPAEINSRETLENSILSAKEGDTIKLTGDINGDININKLVNLDLGGKTVTGNVSITSDAVGILNISNGKIAGNLTVNAPNATVTNEATAEVTGTTEIKDVSNSVFNNKEKLKAEDQKKVDLAVEALNLVNKKVAIEKSAVNKKVAIEKAIKTIVGSDVTLVVTEELGKYSVLISLNEAKSSSILLTVEEKDEQQVPKSTDATITGVKVKGTSATVSISDSKVYNVELSSGTDVTKLIATDVVVTATDINAKVGIATTIDEGKTWTVGVIAEDGKTKIVYKVNVTVVNNNDPKVVNSKEEYEKVLKTALENFESNVTIKVANYNEQDYKLKSLTRIVIENPEIDYGYRGSGVQISGVQGNNEKTLTITMNYSLSKDDMIRQKTATEAKVKEILGNVIKEGMTDVQKEIAIHDYIAKNAEYNLEGLKAYNPTDHNAYGVLVLGKGVCESYAKAFYVLGKSAGLEVKYVTGVGKNSSGSENHAWNMIKLEDGWYNVDVTWDDPVVSNPENKWLEIQYNYFNVPDSIMNNTHLRNKEVKNGILSDSDVIIAYSEATGSKYIYEKLDIVEEDVNGNKFENIKTKKELDTKIKEAIEAKKETLYLKLYNLEMDQEALLNEVQDVIKDNSGMKTNGLTQRGLILTGDSIKLVKYTFTY